ncbi:hypothetical protein H2200_001923 [Cladophialophora chaetospira]|uniref:Uncharacterized protein n=1 Tax=Cladophialophora chaetospira TaxID=386627 RepID=A0AA38XLV9_9EURO|nr:hypothetical protein H2200_001923 [Cladophialophora chaetospira]
MSGPGDAIECITPDDPYATATTGLNGFTLRIGAVIYFLKAFHEMFPGGVDRLASFAGKCKE